MVLFYRSGRKIDIDQGVEFGEDDIDIVGADAGGDDGEAFLADAAGMGDEFAVLGAVFDGIEMLANFGYAVGVAYRQDGRGQFFGAEVEVVDGAAIVYKKFTFRDWLHKFARIFFQVRQKYLNFAPAQKNTAPEGAYFNGDVKRS